MSKFYIGIDGGGSKTAFLCTDSRGNAVGSAETDSTYCTQEGIDTVIARLKDGISKCLPEGEREAAIGFGMPGYGENKDFDEKATAAIREALAPYQIRFENDVVLGWAAGTCMKPGVTVVGGTGSIGYGRDSHGNEARCGGWHEFMSDEGSGYWLGKKLLQMFTKESDGRLPKTALYELTRETLGLKDDFDITDMITNRFMPSRKETAAMQKVLLAAARAGDECALRCYDEAADELAEIFACTVTKLKFADNETVTASFSGGLFNITDLIRNAVICKIGEKCSGMDIVFPESMLTPCQGAVMLAMECFGREDYLNFREKIEGEKQ